jgi:hypothetical protein
MKCSNILEVGGKSFHCCLEDAHEGEHREDVGPSWNNNPVLNKYAFGNAFGLLFRRIGVENWTEQVFLEDARRSRLNNETHQARIKAMQDNGWELHNRYCSRDEYGEYAIDPITKEQISHKEAYLRQEARKPGSVPPWPKFDKSWRPPPSDEGLFNVNDIKPVNISKLRIKRFDIIERQQQMVKEDQAVFDALDGIINEC